MQEVISPKSTMDILNFKDVYKGKHRASSSLTHTHTKSSIIFK